MMTKNSVIRINDANYAWLMENRGAGSIDDVLAILIDHATECTTIQHRLERELTVERLKAKKKGSEPSEEPK